MPIIKRHQNIIDFTTQHEGSAEGAAALAIDNDLSLTDEPTGGTALKAAETLDTKTITALASTDIASKDNVQQGVGLGYWGLATTLEIIG